MKFIDFFAGIGGFRRGLELSGHKCVGFCEWDKYATASYTSMHLITDKQREYLSTLTLKKRQKEILKNEYRNGEWYSNDIRNVDAGSLPAADCWCFGAPCQDFSIAGKRAGLDGDRSSLIREIFRLLEEQKEQNRPEWLIYENVKGMLSSNKGLDYLSILSEMDRLGYDIEWQNINSKWWVPQNRERIYTIGHLRRFGSRKILPVTGADGENRICQIGMRQSDRKNPNAYRVCDKDGVAPALGTMQGGGREPSIAFPCFVDMTIGKGVNLTENARTLCARYQKGMTNHEGTTSSIAIKIIGEVNSSQDGKVHDVSGIAKCHSAGHNNSPKVAIPVLTPDRAEKHQNGRRFKDNGEPMFTLTSQDKHGVGIEVLGGVYTNPSPDYNRGILDGASRTLKADSHPAGVALKIREATKKGYSEAYAGDSINFSVPNSKTRRGRVGRGVAQTLDTSCNQGIFVQVSEELTVYAIWYEKYQCYIVIRKLTPKECFRLQGWTDDYFEKASFVNSDSQLYKQTGNGVTVDVVYAIGKKIAEYENKSLEEFSRYMNKPEKEAEQTKGENHG